MGFFETYLRRPQQLALRQLLFQVHLWTGIVLALYVIVIGVTGSVLVMRTELEWLSGLKPWQDVKTMGPVADLATVVGKLRAAYPGSHIVSVEAPTQSDATFVAVVEAGRRIKVASDPNDGSVLGEFSRRRNWLSVVEDLHETLFLGPKGRRLNGVFAAFLLLMNATGIVIWWQGIRNWTRGLKVDFKRRWRRINFDLHSFVGFWTILIVSFWALSGIYFAWPRQFFLTVDSFSKIISARPPAVTVAAETSAPELDIRSLLRRSIALDPGTSPAGIAFPYSRRAPVGILMRRGNSIGREYVDTVYFNPYSGEYLSTWRYGANQTLGDWIIWLEVPLHFGTYWGLGFKIVWAIAGLAIPLLAVTGLVMYWNRTLRRKWKQISQGTRNEGFANSRPRVIAQHIGD